MIFFSSLEDWTSTRLEFYPKNLNRSGIIFLVSGEDHMLLPKLQLQWTPLIFPESCGNISRLKSFENCLIK